MALGQEGGDSKLGSRLQLSSLSKIHQPLVPTRDKKELKTIGAVKSRGEGGEDEKGDRCAHMLFI